MKENELKVKLIFMVPRENTMSISIKCERIKVNGKKALK